MNAPSISYETVVSACARAAHEANRAYCIALGDMTQDAWADAPQWQRDSSFLGAKKAIEGATPEQLHESWLAEKEASGWKYGPVKDAAKKEHPCMVPYAKLPWQQRAKDDIFRATVRAVAAALGAL